MAYKIQQHILKGLGDVKTVNDFTSKTTKNKQPFDETQNLPDTLIMHYTAGRDALSSANYLTRNDVKASAHLVIGRAGEIYQLVPFNIISWHAGVSSYGGRKGYNKYSIGIEIDNAGVLKKVGSQYQAWFGTKYSESDVIEAIHRNETSPRFWHTYTDEQLKAVEQVTEALVAKYKIKTILGHEEISPGRKQDPGPAFDLDRFREQILGANRESEDSVAPQSSLPSAGKVDASKLNIRQGPGSSYDKVAKPLANGQEVKILDEENGFYKVETKVTGWVSKAFIDVQ